MKKQSNWPRTSRHSRGYGVEWDKLRATILDRDRHLCQCHQCKKLKRNFEATEVHHIISKAEGKKRGWTIAQIDHPSNLQSINKNCHKRETAAEQNRTLIRKGVDDEGWPNHRSI